MASGDIRTTISLPKALLDAADKPVASGCARSRNELVVRALRRELAAQNAAAIDAQIRAAYASRSPEDEAEDLYWAEEGLAEWEAENRRIEAEG